MAQVLTIVPDETKQMITRAQALYNAGDFDGAYTTVQDYLATNPNDAQALILAAVILKKKKKAPIAYALAKLATALKPDRSETWNTLGQCAQQLWRLDEAQESYEKALKRAISKEHRALYLMNIGGVHLDKGEFTEAEESLRKSLAEVPDDHYARHNLGLSLLGQKRWREAWPYYSASIGTENRKIWKYRDPEEPTWDGTKGQRVVVYGEQGLGDEISFASMIPDACLDARVVVDCDHRLEGLFRRSFPQAKVYGTRWAKQGLAWDEEDHSIDASISMGELGRLYRNDEQDFPGTPYLTPCPDRTAGWKATFAAKRKPVIGIAWTGGLWHTGSANRSLPLDEWGPIFKAIDAHWVNLEYKDKTAEAAEHGVTTYPWATLTKDYDDTAALVASCDLVITMQTAVAHLAGALGVPVWVMVPSNSQWRYGESTDSLPWYKSLRIFKARSAWGPVVHKIAGELKSAHIARV